MLERINRVITSTFYPKGFQHISPTESDEDQASPPDTKIQNDEPNPEIRLESESVTEENEIETRRYPLRERAPPKRWYEGKTALISAVEIEPETVEEALKSSCGQQWREAMSEEISSLESNGAWTVVPREKHMKIFFKQVDLQNKEGFHRQHRTIQGARRRERFPTN